MVYDKQGNEKEVHNPSGLPDQTMIDHIEEPYIKASIITSSDYIGPIISQLWRTVRIDMIIKWSVAFRNTLQFVIEVYHNLMLLFLVEEYVRS